MDSTPRLIDDLRAAGDVTEQVAEIGSQSDPGFGCHIHSFQNLPLAFLIREDS